MSGSNILFVFTGSIACFKACEAVSRLVQNGHAVRTVATESALKFVGAATLEGLTGKPPLTDLFAAGVALEHINLTRWADLVVVCPATANTLNRLAAGLADDLVGALFLAHDWSKPWLIAPAMNPAMWNHPATMASVDRLKFWGVRFVDVGEGRTACGEVGEGRLAEPLEIVAGIEAALAEPPRKLRVLVTSGGTSEPIDGVRVLTNTSTGSTGTLLAAHFVSCGHEVTLLRAKNAAPCPPLAREETFSTFGDLDGALTRLLGEEDFDAVIHAAAVGDFSVERVQVDGRLQTRGAKIDSSAHVTIELRPNPKLLATLRARSRNPELKVVAFKLTTGASEAEVKAAVDSLFIQGTPDFVVHNDLAMRGAGEFPATIYALGDKRAIPCPTRAVLAATLEELLSLMHST